MYCSNCGKETIKVETSIYDINTGKKIYEDKCLSCDKAFNIKFIIWLILVILSLSVFVFCGSISQ